MQRGLQVEMGSQHRKHQGMDLAALHTAPVTRGNTRDFRPNEMTLGPTIPENPIF
uniref:Uncharacterized protein n=1 Tax=Anguilla anguilla TaxID=7936 RepID=A0A0E9TJY2_ANGAN